MKKILSMLVLAALLLATLGVSVSAGSYYDRNNSMSYKDAKFQVRKATATIDGIISPGEYDEFTGNCEWYIGEMASAAYEDAAKMAETLKWYFSWDGTNFNFAVVYDAGQGANQTYPGGTYYGDYDNPGEDGKTFEADQFLGFGPGLNFNSAEVSPRDQYWHRFSFAIGENTSTGEGIVGYYTGQNGQADAPYLPVHGQDFDVTYNGSIVTIEWKIPVYQLNESFDPSKGTANFKASFSVHAGLADETVTEGINTYAYGVRMGMLGYNCDSSVEDAGHATFLLTKNEIPQEGGNTTQAPTTQPTTQPTEGPTTNDTEEPTTAPVVPGPGDVTTKEPVGGNDDPQPTETTTTVGDDEPIVTPNPEVPGDDKPEDDKPVVNNPVDTKPINPGNKPGAAQTGDPMIIAAVVAAISACGVVVAKKRK